MEKAEKPCPRQPPHLNTSKTPQKQNRGKTVKIIDITPLTVVFVTYAFRAGIAAHRAQITGPFTYESQPWLNKLQNCVPTDDLGAFD